MSDITVSISHAIINGIFTGVVDTFKFEHADPHAASLGPVTLGYDVAFHFRNDTAVQPTLDLRDDGSIFLHNLKILWDKLELTVGIDIPTIQIGAFCLIPIPFDGCLVPFPGITLFDANPDISFTLALDQLITSELSVDAAFGVSHISNPNRLPTDSDWDAHDNKRGNHWELSVVAPVVHVDPFHVADIVADLFKKAIQDSIDSILNGLGVPGFIRDLIDKILGGIEHLIRVVLNIGDNIVQWLENALNGPVNLLDFIATFVTDFLLRNPIPIVEDPLPILEDKSGKPNPLIPIMIPIVGLQASVTAAELVLEGSVG
jgi:hypothetical protein